MKLGDVFKLSSGKSLPEKKRTSGSHNVYGGNGITGNHNDYFVEKPTIVIGRVGEYCGAVHLTTEKCWITDNALMVTEWYQEVDKQYLVYVLNAMNLHQYAKTVGQPSISQANVYSLDIKLPLMEQQREIVKILNLVSKIIKDRREELKRLDELIKARFVEMFGDPEINNYGWDESSIGDNCFVTKLAGFEYTKYINYADSGDVVMVKAQNVKNGVLNEKDLSYISNEVSDSLPRSQLAPGDVVMTYVGANIGDVAIIDDKYKYHLAPNVAKIRPDNNAFNSMFFMYMLMMKTDYIMRNSADTAKAALGMERIRKLSVFVPSLDLQEQFASFVQQVDKSKFPVLEYLPKQYIIIVYKYHHIDP